MKKLFVVANWKSNKTEFEANKWFQRFKINDLRFTNKEIIVCPTFTLLPLLKSYLLNLKSSVKLGAQDISPFNEGAYTGEVNGKQIKEFADYVIIGHSERRTHFKEDDSMLERKVQMAKQAGLIPVFCVQDETTAIPDGVTIVAYEPPAAIGTGNPDTPENADRVAGIIRQKSDALDVLYGGSVNAANVKSFTQMQNISGVLVGGASLDPLEFREVINNA